MPVFLFLVFVAVVGAIFGSFITAMVYRQRHGLSMWARHSICPECKHALGALDLLPIVSFVWQRGRCRYCGGGISWHYVATEIVSLVLFLSLGGYLLWQLERWWPIDLWWLLLSGLFMAIILVLLLAMSIYDLKWRELPNAWTLGGAGLSLLAVIVAELLGQPIIWQPQVAEVAPGWLNTLLSGLVAAAVFLLVGWLSEKLLRKPGMGLGDVKLALLMGFFLGFPGIIVAMYVAFIFGAMLSLLLIAGKRKTLGATLPFGPFLALGAWLALFIAEPVVNWYKAFLM